MLFSTFMEYALEGYGAVVKNGMLERVPMKDSKQRSPQRNNVQPTQEENIQTIVAFIESVKEQYGPLCSHLATLLLINTIQKKEVLDANIILSTYQSMLEIEKVLRDDYVYFTKLPLFKQKEYMLLMVYTKVSLAEREILSRAFFFQSFFNQDYSSIPIEQ